MNSSCFVADVAVSSGLVVWDEHRPKPSLSAHHGLVGLFGLFQRILLDVTLDTLIKRELDRLERVPRASAGPTPDRQAFLNERHTGNLQIVADNGEDEQGPIDSETTDEPLDNIGVGRGTHDQIGTAELVERLGLILLRSVDVYVSTEFLGEILLRVGGRKGDSLETGFGSELDTQMAKTTETLDGDNSSGLKTHVPHGVKGGHSGAEQRSLSRVQLFRDLRDPGEVEGDVFGVSSIGQDSVDTLVLASRVVALSALYAGEAVGPVPSTPDSVPDFKRLDTVTDRDDISDDLVTGDTGKDRHHLLLDQVVTPTDTTSEDLDDDLPLLRLLHLDIDHFKGLALFLLLKGLVSLWKRHCGSDLCDYDFVVREMRKD